MNKKSATIVGGGPTGALLAIQLARRGYRVEVYEKRPDPRQGLVERGRSINLAISVRGLMALEKVGLKKAVLNEGIPMLGRLMHSVEGKLSFQPYGRDPSEHLNAISRHHLNCVLIEAAKDYDIEYFFGHNALGADFINKRLLVREEKTQREKDLSFEVLFATDGSASKIRSDVVRFHDQHYSHRDELAHIYKELTIPAGPKGEFLLEKERLHIWPRGGFMLIALPNLDGSFTCTLFLAGTGPESMESLKTGVELKAFFQKYFPDVLPLMPSLEEDFFKNPTGHLYTIHTFPWCVEGETLLLGDAAHAIVPFLGQGMNACFEDVSVFMDLYDQNPGLTWEQLFKRFETERFPNTEAIAQMALDNFLEMRDHVGQAKFLLKKQIEHKLMKDYPDEFFSKYNLITFGQTPYAFAQKVGVLQEQLLQILAQNIESLEEMDPGFLAREFLDYTKKEQKLRQEFAL